MAKFDPRGVATPPNFSSPNELNIKNNSGKLVVELITRVRCFVPSNFSANPAAELVIKLVLPGINHRQNTRATAKENTKKGISPIRLCNSTTKLFSLEIK
ncbi:hypothetical protein [Pleurocapsa sp. PCC 7319]|uniref:hypothetical protein n=1 Tax=Pleurocapsa sp. PCC 7319 TaxID=118161 RepID=UPI00192AEA47|nr:hypothetical protein [Pleurocapsa sp. PCC 7319]